MSIIYEKEKKKAWQACVKEEKEFVTGLHELWDRVEKEWEAIPKDVVQNLIASMPRRCAAVVKAKGGHTKY